MTFKKRPNVRRILKPPTVQTLGRIAEHYLARFSASEASVRRVLHNRLHRIAMSNLDFAADQTAQTQLKSAVETIIERYVKSGVLNDALYAETKRQNLRRAGRSKLVVVQKLAAKGIHKDLIAQTLAHEQDDAEHDDDHEKMAAQKFARRKKFGPYATKSIDANQQKKQVASMARAGFRFQLIKQVLEATLDDIETDGNMD